MGVRTPHQRNANLLNSHSNIIKKKDLGLPVQTNESLKFFSGAKQESSFSYTNSIYIVPVILVSCNRIIQFEFCWFSGKTLFYGNDLN